METIKNNGKQVFRSKVFIRVKLLTCAFLASKNEHTDKKKEKNVNEKRDSPLNDLTFFSESIKYVISCQIVSAGAGPVFSLLVSCIRSGFSVRQRTYACYKRLYNIMFVLAFIV